MKAPNERKSSEPQADDSVMTQRIHSRISVTSRARSYVMRPSRGAPRTTLSRGFIDNYTILPTLACVFAVIVTALEYKIFTLPPTETRLDSRVFWPVMAA